MRAYGFGEVGADEREGSLDEPARGCDRVGRFAHLDALHADFYAFGARKRAAFGHFVQLLRRQRSDARVVGLN